MKILLATYSLGQGGAERVLTTLANHWSNSHDVTIMTFDNDKIESFYCLNENIIRKHISINDLNFIESIKQLKQFLTIYEVRNFLNDYKPDAVISFIDTMNVKILISSFMKNFPVIVSERSDPIKRKISLVNKILRFILYNNAYKIVVQTTGTKLYFSKYLLTNNITVINNPISNEFTNTKRIFDFSTMKPYIVSVGRLVFVKRYDILLKSFAQTLKLIPELSLVLVGDGPLRSELENIASELNIEKNVYFVGESKFVQKYLQNAELFVLSSDMEGFPNALVEAMACGLPVICTNCSSGPREIIENGVNGILVEPDNVSKLSEQIYFLMTNDDERKRLASNAVKVIERYGMDRILRQWDDLLDSATK